MEKRWHSALLPSICLLSLVALALTASMRSNEPEYQNKPLSYYLDTFATNYPPKSAYDPNIKAIHAMGPAAIPHLRRSFREKNSTYVKSLTYLGAKLPKWAAIHLPRPNMASLANHSNAAAHCLATFGPIASNALPDLIVGLEDRSIANMAFYAIMEVGPRPENLPHLLAQLTSTNSSAVPSYLISCIAKIGIASPEVLAALTHHATNQNLNSLDRSTAIDTLGALGVKASPAVEVLKAVSTGTNAQIRMASVMALWRIQGNTNPPIAWLNKELETQIGERRTAPGWRKLGAGPELNLLWLVFRLKELGEAALPAKGSLETLTRTRNIQLRLNAVEGLWRIANETNYLVAVCAEALTNSNHNIREYSARLLADYCIESKSAPPQLTSMLSSEDLFTRFYAARAFARLEVEDASLVPTLVSGLNDHFTYYRNATIRQLAAETLGELGSTAQPAVPDLIRTLDDGVPAVRIAASNALEQIDPDALRTSKK